MNRKLNSIVLTTFTHLALTCVYAMLYVLASIKSMAFKHTFLL